MLGAEDLNVRYKVDTRLADSDERITRLRTYGEQKTAFGITALAIQNQRAVTTRGILKWGGSKGQSINLEVNEDRNNIDLAFESFVLDFIVKERKRSHHVGL